MYCERIESIDFVCTVGELSVLSLYYGRIECIVFVCNMGELSVLSLYVLWAN